ncbi:MAG: hypothetical protein METHP_00725 [Methanoregula sp. SKADARSKE-2]|nr:MAG: hypothetical protein METHP_00725 [Methanoregula sp. SKADARSKE-2]
MSPDNGRGECSAAGSESIGFLLILTIVIMGIGTVTLYGYPMLIQQQAGADEQIMEKSLIVLQNDLKSLAYKSVPYKETSLKVGGGSLTLHTSLESPSPAYFSVFDDAGVVASPADLLLFPIGDLRYLSLSAESMISLQNGAVVKRSTVIPGSVMLAEPRWFIDSSTNTAVIYLIAFNSSTVLARSRHGPDGIRGGHLSSTHSYSTGRSGPCTLSSGEGCRLLARVEHLLRRQPEVDPRWL